MRILFVSMLLILIGCAKGSDSPAGGSQTPSNPIAPVLPTCKSISSVWHSNNDLEVHNFTNVQTSYQAYAYTGYNGVNCASGTAKLYVSGATALNAGYEYTIEFQVSNPAIGCEHWQDGLPNHGSALIDLGCNVLTMCQGVNVNCKSFH